METTRYIERTAPFEIWYRMIKQPCLFSGVKKCLTARSFTLASVSFFSPLILTNAIDLLHIKSNANTNRRNVDDGKNY